MIIFDKELGIFSSTLLNEEIVSAGFGTKKTGDGLDYASVNAFYKQTIPTYKSIYIPDQTHSTVVYTVTSTENKFSISEQADGLVTSQTGVILTVLTADCVPIIFVDQNKKLIGISHQGWKGTLHGMAREMVESMKKLGAAEENITAVIGPTINDCCYEVYGERLKLFKEKYPQYSDIIRKDGQKTYLNLAKLNFYQLLDAGLKKEHIDHFPFCTSCDSDRFFSYHRDKEIKGEMINFVMLNI